MLIELCIFQDSCIIQGQQSITDQNHLNITRNYFKKRHTTETTKKRRKEINKEIKKGTNKK